VLKILTGTVRVVAVLLLGYYLYTRLVGNPAVIDELRADPNGQRAARVMLITLPDGRELPVNYLRESGVEGENVYVGVDGLWWRLFADAAQPVSLLIRGETLTGQARAILDDPAYTKDVFARLRPTAPTWLPGRMGGVLVEVKVDLQTMAEE